MNDAEHWKKKYQREKQKCYNALESLLKYQKDTKLLSDQLLEFQSKNVIAPRTDIDQMNNNKSQSIVLSEDELKELTSISDTKDKDRCFATTLIEILYRNDPEKLPHRSVKGNKACEYITNTGVMKKRTEKCAISPNKKACLDKYFNERINELDEKDAYELSDKISRLKTNYQNEVYKNSLNYAAKKYSKICSKSDKQLNS